MTQSISELYDHEVAAILGLQRELNARAEARQHNYNDFEREIRDRFAALGFTVDVNWYRFGRADGDGVLAEVEGAAMPEITITGRTAKIEWDPDRQVHEVVHDVLGLGDAGWIKTDPGTLKRFQDGHDH